MKKYCFKLFIIFIALASLLNYASASMLSLLGKKIIIDVGHGGKDPGTSYGDILEKDINLNIALYLKSELIKRGATVILTRYDDYDLSKPNAKYRKKSDFDNRINLINYSNYDVYLSIHLNYLNDYKYFGPQVFYDKDNLELASLIQKTMNKELNGDRKIKSIPSKNYMYNKLTIPGVLIECGFISNNEERNKLVTKDYQLKIAKSITKSLEEYF